MLVLPTTCLQVNATVREGMTESLQTLLILRSDDARHGT